MTVGFRLRPSAVIIRDGAILLIEYDEPRIGLHYNLPGGGLHPEEMVHDGLRRELREEACAEIEIGPLLMVWEMPPGSDGPNHHLGLVFRCELVADSGPLKPSPGDTFQVGIRWVPLVDLPKKMLLPRPLALRLPEALAVSSVVDPFVVGQW